MTYEHHLRLLIGALLEAQPTLSCAAISAEAGVHKNWVGSFLQTEAGTFRNGRAVVGAVRRLCPQGPKGDPVRRLLAVFEQDVVEREAAA